MLEYYGGTKIDKGWMGVDNYVDVSFIFFCAVQYSLKVERCQYINESWLFTVTG